MQDCCIGPHVAAWLADFLPFTYTWHFSPCYLSSTPHPLLSFPCFPQTDPSGWCSPPCVHVFLLFNTHLWVRICSVWFSVLVSVCWEWWFSDSSMSLQRTWTHPFLMAAYYSMVYMCNIFFIHSIFDGHLGWFQVFAIVNSATVNFRMHVSLW